MRPYEVQTSLGGWHTMTTCHGLRSAQLAVDALRRTSNGSKDQKFRIVDAGDKVREILSY
jgi:hypothetical protein